MLAPELQTAILASLVQHAASADASALDDLERIGLEPEDIDALRQTSVAELPLLAQHNVIECRVSHTALARARLALHNSDQRGRRIAELVRRGASRRMLRELCGLSAHEIKVYRRALDVAEASNGRLPEPSAELAHRVCQLWHEHAGSDELERYLAIHDAIPDTDIRVIHRALQCGGCV